MSVMPTEDDADIDKELEEYKQELVSNNLVPKEQANEKGHRHDAYIETTLSFVGPTTHKSVRSK